MPPCLAPFPAPATLLGSGKGIKVGDDGEEVPAYYHQWAAKIQDMSPARQADVLDQLGEDDRLIVQRILDHNAVQRSNDSAMSGLSQRQSQQAHPASPTGSDSPPPYSAVASPRVARPVSGASSRPVSPQDDHGSFAQTDQGGRSVGDAHGRSWRQSDQQKKKGTSAADLGIFDFDSQSSSELDQRGGDSQAHESRAAEAESARSPTQRQEAQPSMQSQQQPAADADFLGFGSSQEAAEEAFMPESPPADQASAQPSQPSYPPPPSSVPPATPDDLADFFSAPAASPGSPSNPTPQSSTTHIDDMFTAAPKPAPPVHKPQPAASSAASSAASASGAASRQGQGGPAGAGAGGGVRGAQPTPKAAPKAAAPASMIDFGNEAALLAEHPDLYKGLEEVPGEPAYRKELRQKRVREMHQRMQAQLAEKQARDASESSEKEEKVDLRSRVVKPRIEAWTQGKKDNIRALLSTLHTVLWEGSGWAPPQMTDLVETGKVKRQYMKANLIIHPDKVKQKGGTVEQIVIADMAFDVLKNAWGKFESGELRK
ncbi:hypothetical protein ABBQ38_005683 [Trebouxia sp. C0009 RCD-2024]